MKGQMRTFVPGSNTAVCPPEHFLVAHDATVQAHVLQYELPVLRADHGMAPGDKRLCSTTSFAGSRPIVTSAASTSTTTAGSR